MAKSSRKVSERAPRPRPAATPEEQESRMIALAMNAAEEQLRSGRASSQVITHFLKLATAKAELERDKLRSENQLLKAKTEAIDAQRNTEELYAEAIKAMRVYSGEDDNDSDIQ